MRLAAIEAGGTKFVVAIGDEFGNIIKRDAFATTSPQETFEHVFEFFDGEEFEAMGIGTFGPIDLDLQSPTYGFITSTPKPNWGNVDFVGPLKERYQVPIAFDTDVNGAALGELYFGSAKGLDSCLYLTIGTGIGGGAIVEGKLVHGLLHPEMGHILLAKHKDETTDGFCPFHKNCLEGLASGPAIEKRWGTKAYDLPVDHPAWEMEGYYLAEALMNFILTLSPQKIILGGGVMKQTQIFNYIHQYVVEMLNGYVQKEEILHHIKDYIVYPKLGDNAGICGALALAMQARKNA